VADKPHLILPDNVALPTADRKKLIAVAKFAIS